MKIQETNTGHYTSSAENLSLYEKIRRLVIYEHFRILVNIRAI